MGRRWRKKNAGPSRLVINPSEGVPGTSCMTPSRADHSIGFRYGSAGTFLLCAGIAFFAGCQVFSSDSGGSTRSLNGTLPDGGTCTKDSQTIKNVMLAPPVCNATAPCPCGTFCSSQTGGNCVADCVDDTWCAPGYACSPFGQCLKAGAGSDGGVTTTDPSCPKNTTLLTSLRTAPRSCDFDDACPYGSFCNHLKGTCDYTCSADGDCSSMSTVGHTFVCGCLGQCLEVAAPSHATHQRASVAGGHSRTVRFQPPSHDHDAQLGRHQ